MTWLGGRAARNLEWEGKYRSTSTQVQYLLKWVIWSCNRSCGSLRSGYGFVEVDIGKVGGVYLVWWVGLIEERRGEGGEGGWHLLN